MQSDLFIHEIVHKIEAARASRPFKYFIVVLVLVMLGVIYNYRVYKNLSTQEAMDAAQLGRNLAEGRGYTTMFVRPFSMYLVKQRNEQKLGKAEAGKYLNYSEIKTNHPDISNPPLYPVVLERDPSGGRRADILALPAGLSHRDVQRSPVSAGDRGGVCLGAADV
jgi:hypothetical protein